MALIYPETPVPQYPLSWSTEFKTIVSTAESGVEQRRQQWRFQKRSVQVSYKVLNRLEMNELWNFYVERMGSLKEFTFVEPDFGVAPYDTYNDEYVARGDGTKTQFTIPSRNASNITMYIDGTDVTSANPSTLIGYDVAAGVMPTSGEVTITDATGYAVGVTVPTDQESGASTDQITFTTPPALGAMITMDFTGCIAMRSRFTQDKLSRDMFMNVLYNIGLSITEIKSA